MCVQEAGSDPTNCGAFNIDCTSDGDQSTVCIFSNHCLCSDGFICESYDDSTGECDPSATCIEP